MSSRTPYGVSPDGNSTSLRLRSAVKELVQQSGDKDESKCMALSGTMLFWRHEVPDSSHVFANDREEYEVVQ